MALDIRQGDRCRRASGSVYRKTQMSTDEWLSKHYSTGGNCLCSRRPTKQVVLKVDCYIAAVD